MTSPMPQMPSAPAGDPLSEMGFGAAPALPPELSSLLLGPQSGPGAAPQPTGAGAAVAGPGLAGAPASTMPPTAMPDGTAYDTQMMQAVDTDIRSEFQARHGRQPTTFEVNAVHALPMIELNLGRKPTRMEMLQYLTARDETPLATSPFYEVTQPADMGMPGAPTPTVPGAM